MVIKLVIFKIGAMVIIFWKWVILIHFQKWSPSDQFWKWPKIGKIADFWTKSGWFYGPRVGSFWALQARFFRTPQAWSWREFWQKSGQGQIFVGQKSVDLWQKSTDFCQNSVDFCGRFLWSVGDKNGVGRGQGLGRAGLRGLNRPLRHGARGLRTVQNGPAGPNLIKFAWSGSKMVILGQKWSFRGLRQQVSDRRRLAVNLGLGRPLKWPT